MNVYIKMQDDILKRADPDFNPIFTAKLGRLENDFWIVLGSFAYCIPEKMFLLSFVGFGEFTPEGTRKTFDDAHGLEDKIKLDRTSVIKQVDKYNLVEFYASPENILYFDEKLLKKFPPNCIVAVRTQDMRNKQRMGFMLDPVTNLCYGAIMEFRIKDRK